MIVSVYNRNGKTAEVHQEDNHYTVKLYENDRLVETTNLTGHSIHYAESLAENYVGKVGSFNEERKFLRD